MIEVSPEVAELGLEQIELGAQRGADEVGAQRSVLVTEMVQVAGTCCVEHAVSNIQEGLHLLGRDAYNVLEPVEQIGVGMPDTELDRDLREYLVQGPQEAGITVDDYALGRVADLVSQSHEGSLPAGVALGLMQLSVRNILALGIGSVRISVKAPPRFGVIPPPYRSVATCSGFDVSQVAISVNSMSR